MMYPFLAGLLFEEWEAQYVRPVPPPRPFNTLIAYERPHIYPPAVPATFRGLKWGQR